MKLIFIGFVASIFATLCYTSTAEVSHKEENERTLAKRSSDLILPRDFLEHSERKKRSDEKDDELTTPNNVNPFNIGIIGIVGRRRRRSSQLKPSSSASPEPTKKSSAPYPGSGGMVGILGRKRSVDRRSDRGFFSLLGKREQQDTYRYPTNRELEELEAEIIKNWLLKLSSQE